MSETDQFWQYAREAMLSACDAQTSEDKQDLLGLARVWTQAALRTVRAIAPCAEAEGAGLRPTRSPFAKRLLIAEVPLRGVAHRAAFVSAANSRPRFAFPKGPRKRGKHRARRCPGCCPDLRSLS
jgi:hypothetical protein